ncbi:Maf-like protein [Clostridium folliculivorans]|uniref:dTTP/UTP pyrophosphatase n=1 Tax=Clostridium folliculivorans TaxID=2886038 RepID=A0A9W6D7X6_9CLOT|nr:Maf-like protein [Clostridium folliculivorans]GKU23385.1 Maf-like protein [Clostridium folliculivorans]GKU29502.1 Maf-like protein [Clostridium folliculivorans]
MNFILASASDRRKELLSRLVKEYEVIPSSFDEDSVKFAGDVGNYVKELSLGKAEYIRNDIKKPSIIIAADTVVSLEDKVLGKPKDKGDAFKMLQSLSGKTHQVYSGITVINTENNKLISDYVCTDVTFSELSKEEIDEYINTGEPMDKAGSYGIQGFGGVFVEKIDGCYYSVVGLPLNKLKNILIDIVK